MAAIDPAKLADLKTQHGPKLFIITASYFGDEIEVVCKPPSGAAIKRFALTGKSGDELGAQDGFFADVCVYPDPVKLSEDAYPVVSQVVQAMVELMGIGNKAKAKKA